MGFSSALHNGEGETNNLPVPRSPAGTGAGPGAGEWLCRMPRVPSWLPTLVSCALSFSPVSQGTYHRWVGRQVGE